MEPLIRCTVLGIILVTARYFQKKFNLPPIPIRLPAIAIIATLVTTYAPKTLDTLIDTNWMNAGLDLIRSYAYLQLIVWMGLDLPSKIRWWPRPAKCV